MEQANIIIRNGLPSDHASILAVMPDWWNGRDLTDMLLKIFFVHFNDTVFIVEEGGELIGFLVGFFSQSRPGEGYIHLVGVHPRKRQQGLARTLYDRFVQVCRQRDISVIRACTSPVNKLSIAFHAHMGFDIEPGDGLVDGVPVTLNYLRENDPKVLFIKDLR